MARYKIWKINFSRYLVIRNNEEHGVYPLIRACSLRYAIRAKRCIIQTDKKMAKEMNSVV